MKYMMKLKTIAIVILAGVLATGCVSKKKFQEMQTLKNQIQEMLDTEKESKEALQAKLDETNRKLKDCDDYRTRLAADSARLAMDVTDLQKTMDGLKMDCETLRDNYRQLKSQNSKQIQGLIDELETLQRDLKAREARLAEVEAGIRSRDSVMNALRQRISDALLGFKDQGLSVEIKDGKVYVSLSNKLLFESGSTKIDKNGQLALKELARVLKEQKDLTIMVEGHTDDVKVTNLGQIKDNWDLSVMRSTEVVRLLTGEGVETTRVIPSGRGEFVPKVAGSTSESRAANRRTEIILSPKLDELYNLLNGVK
jgi:chemotaxis protein MotB